MHYYPFTFLNGHTARNEAAVPCIQARRFFIERWLLTGLLTSEQHYLRLLTVLEKVG